ncbi:MAG: GLPGLI family protein [Chlorobi bacterium]|nr:GLPGLI family protein [Chlorobiota bacterium]
MKKTVLNLILLFITAISQSQTGRITYFSDSHADIKVTSDMSPAQRKVLADMLRKQFEKNYVLEFSGNTSVYYEKPELEENTNPNIRITIIDGSSGKLYKSISEKRYVKTDESTGKRFLISDELPEFKWKLIDSTKQIAGYTCKKAEYLKEEFNENDSLIKTTVSVWYAPELPVSNGPNNLWGLPGMILEVHEGKLLIKAEKIELNTKGIKIKEPEKGKRVSQKEFDKIKKEHTKKMIEMYKGGRKKDNGNTIKIEIN